MQDLEQSEILINTVFTNRKKIIRKSAEAFKSGK